MKKQIIYVTSSVTKHVIVTSVFCQSATNHMFELSFHSLYIHATHFDVFHFAWDCGKESPLKHDDVYTAKNQFGWMLEDILKMLTCCIGTYSFFYLLNTLWEVHDLKLRNNAQFFLLSVSCSL